jgi:hypothetical protein
MAFLVANLPRVECYVRKEFLYDLQPDPSDPKKLKGAGELTPCYWVSCKSMLNQALRFEVMLTEYGALYDKFPLHAFVWKTDVDHSSLLPLDHLELWDCFSYHITVIEKVALLGTSGCTVMLKDRKRMKGIYMFTIDSAEPDYNTLNVGLSETPHEHKSHNIIKLENGQYACQPNNRILWSNQSFISSPDKLQKPDLKVSTRVWSVERNGNAYVEDGDDYFYDIVSSSDKV